MSRLKNTKIVLQYCNADRLKKTQDSGAQPLQNQTRTVAIHAQSALSITWPQMSEFRRARMYCRLNRTMNADFPPPGKICMHLNAVFLRRRKVRVHSSIQTTVNDTTPGVGHTHVLSFQSNYERRPVVPGTFAYKNYHLHIGRFIVIQVFSTQKQWRRWKVECLVRDNLRPSKQLEGLMTRSHVSLEKTSLDSRYGPYSMG